MIYEVTAGMTNSITLNESNTTKAILQNVAMILATPKGTVPQYRGFGLSMTFLDRPITVAQPLIHAEVLEAVAALEPRATVESVSCAYSVDSPHKLEVTVEVSVDE